MLFRMCGFIFKKIQTFLSNLRRKLKIEKIIDKTPIYVVKDHVWTDHFCKKFRGNEPYTNLKMKELLPELEDGTYIIDVGAHVGDTGLYLAHHLQTMYPDKHIDVIMMEPDETKVDFINQMVRLNRLNNCIVMNCGVSDARGCGRIEKNEEFPGASLVKESEGHDIVIEKIDDLTNDVKVSMMHIDVEGMEHKCLLGSVNTISNVKYIIIELNDICDRDAERVFLKNNGYVRIPNAQMYSEYNNELYVKDTENLHNLEKKNQ
jgi:FkbM family methyltransferase